MVQKHFQFEPGKWVWYIHEGAEHEIIHKGDAALIVQNLGPSPVRVSETAGIPTQNVVPPGQIKSFTTGGGKDAVVYFGEGDTTKAACGIVLIVPTVR